MVSPATRNSRLYRALCDLDVAAADADAAAAAPALPRLAFTGGIASGKDTIAAAVAAGLSPEPAVLSFAAPLRAEASVLIAAAEAGEVSAGCRRLGLSGTDARRAAETAVRCAASRGHRRDGPLLQLLGTDIRRRDDDRYWLRPFAAAAAAAITDGRPLLSVDGRFPNELDLLSQLGFTLIRLVVPEPVRRCRLRRRDGAAGDLRDLNHTSERALDRYAEFDATIDNSGTVADTVAQVWRALERRSTVGRSRDHRRCVPLGSAPAGHPDRG